MIHINGLRAAELKLSKRGKAKPQTLRPALAVLIGLFKTPAVKVCRARVLIQDQESFSLRISLSQQAERRCASGTALPGERPPCIIHSTSRQVWLLHLLPCCQEAASMQSYIIDQCSLQRGSGRREGEREQESPQKGQQDNLSLKRRFLHHSTMGEKKHHLMSKHKE